MASKQELTLPGTTFDFAPGNLPLLISIPHNGSAIPEEIAEGMTDAGRSSCDTDWFLDRLYDVPEAKEANRLAAKLSRYVIDLNRPRNDVSLYPGQTTTGLIPTMRFDGEPIYTSRPPSPEDIEQRILRIWDPWHEKTADALARTQAEHGVAVLLEAHSIKSVVPRLFDGALPDFNIGTYNGISCDEGLTNAVMDVLTKQDLFSRVVNGRFIGGYITRRFGDPGKNIHAMQIELSQATYMNEATLEWDSRRAAEVQPVLGRIIAAMIRWAQSC